MRANEQLKRRLGIVEKWTAKAEIEAGSSGDSIPAVSNDMGGGSNALRGRAEDIEEPKEDA